MFPSQLPYPPSSNKHEIFETTEDGGGGLFGGCAGLPGGLPVFRAGAEPARAEGDARGSGARGGEDEEWGQGSGMNGEE